MNLKINHPNYAICVYWSIDWFRVRVLLIPNSCSRSPVQKLHPKNSNNLRTVQTAHLDTLSRTTTPGKTEKTNTEQNTFRYCEFSSYLETVHYPMRFLRSTTHSPRMDPPDFYAWETPLSAPCRHCRCACSARSRGDCGSGRASRCSAVGVQSRKCSHSRISYGKT